MLHVQLSQYLLKESQPALHADGKLVYMLNDEGISPYPIYLNQPIMIGIGTNWTQHNGYKEIIKKFISSIDTFPMYMIFETYMYMDCIEESLKEKNLYVELIFKNKKRDTRFVKVLITTNDDIHIIFPYFFQSAQDSLYTLLSYSKDHMILNNTTGEIELRADDCYPSFSFMYDAQELFVIGGEEKWSDIHYIKKFFLSEQIKDELTIDLRK